MKTPFTAALRALALVLLLAPFAVAHATSTKPVTPCVRYAPGLEIVAPTDLYSTNGILRVTLSYQSRVDTDGTVLYCYMTPDGIQSPTLHVKPGDELLITLTNNLPPSTNPSFRNHSMPGMDMNTPPPSLEIVKRGLQTCGGMVMTATSTNMHFHGTNVPPDCHQDEVIKTLVNSGETFQYDVHFPIDEPPGLYWYHPHIHGISEPAVQGGATGAIIVDGIENVNNEVAGMYYRELIVRDTVVPSNIDPDSDNLPAWNLSLNYSPITYPAYKVPVIPMKRGGSELWRVLNSAADTILDLQVLYDGVPQDLRIVAIDGVPTGSQDGTAVGTTLVAKHYRLPPAARVEFVIAAPDKTVKVAQLVTTNIDTGPFGDNDPDRPLANIKSTGTTGDGSLKLPAATNSILKLPRFTGLAKAVPTVTRKLYFSEILSDPTDPNSPTNFFITVDGATPTLFDPNNPPAIVTTQGTTEDWIIENRALENHEFHIHQIHFLVLEQNGQPVDGQYQDMIDVPYWDGVGPYPSVKLRMDFRGNYVGDFVYHCHILGHEDFGMMAVIRVLPAN